LISWFRCG